MRLFMILVGGKPERRYTEQHDVFFGIGDDLRGLIPELYLFWPELTNKMHIDSWRLVTKVDQYKITIVPKNSMTNEGAGKKLYFVNLGGYKESDMEEYHYKQLVVAANLAEATQLAKQTVFWKHHNSSHVDDKYGIDVDDIYEIKDMLSPAIKEQYQIVIEDDTSLEEDDLEIGYLKISKLLKS